MKGHRHAILMGTSTYEDSRLRNLACPERDVRGLQEILQASNSGQFDSVEQLINPPYAEMARTIQKSLNRAGPGDLVLLYYSGHGKLNHFERLFLTATDTETDALESTALPVHTIRELIDVSSCRRVVLLLDCCYSGAAGDVFVKGGVEDQLQRAGSHGRGTYIITASTAIEAAQEKEGEEHSVFTKHVIQGLRTGEADRNHDGLVTVDELYDYVRNRMVEDAAGQEPSKWGIDVRSELVIAKSGRTPRKKLRSAVRARLAELWQKDQIPGEVITRAEEILSKAAGASTPAEQAYQCLLEELLDHRMGPAQFVLEWGRVERRESPVPEPPPFQPPEVKEVETGKTREREPRREPAEETSRAEVPAEPEERDRPSSSKSGLSTELSPLQAGVWIQILLVNSAGFGTLVASSQTAVALTEFGLGLGSLVSLILGFAGLVKRSRSVVGLGAWGFLLVGGLGIWLEDTARSGSYSLTGTSILLLLLCAFGLYAKKTLQQM